MKALALVFAVIYLMIFVVVMIGMYFVKDYRNGIIYNGFWGKVQNLIKH